MNRSLALLALALFAAACGPSSGRRMADLPDGGPPKMDDPAIDQDGDGVSAAQGDCRDNDATVYPGAPELCDGLDHDCNGISDDTCDDDMDGYSIIAGDKPGGDCNDQDALVNPGAVEVAGDMVDNDCNGAVDEAPVPCDQGLKKTDTVSFAHSIELCGPSIVSATLNGDADKRAFGIRTKYGKNYFPKAGSNFIMLSTGLAADMTDASFVPVQEGTEFANDDPNPAPMQNKNACYMGPDEMTVHDYVELTLHLKVPTNAKSFSFQFMFVSAEYPEFVGTEFNDKFLAILTSKSYNGNISFDANNNPITVNAGFFDVCDTAKVCNGQKTNTCTKPLAQLAGTGYEQQDWDGSSIGGGTGWLTTTSPVTPGEEATLRFIIFDEGDHIYDSSVIIDNFQWKGEPSMGPTTIG
jgi:Putative metal-binding motif